VKFGMFYEWPNPELRNWRELFEEGIEQIQYAEEMGFDFVLIAEHHFTNYGMSPAPLMQALYIAERTQRIQIATAVLVLPIWQPLRLAEEVAVLDNLTNGRFICGIGRGYQPHEFARYGVIPEQSRSMFNEALDIILQAWTCDESFAHEGEHYRFPETVVWPKPYQRPHPPLWVAGSSADTIRLAAERDMVPVTSGFFGPAGIRDATALLVQHRAALGKPYHGLDVGLQTMTLVADSDEEAWEVAHRAQWQNRAGRALGRSDVKHGRVSASPYQDEPDEEGLRRRLYYGRPDTVIERFREASDGGATIISTWMMHGGMEHERIMKSIRLMGEHVIPALRDVHPPASLPDDLLEHSQAAGALEGRPPAPSE
jgi:alkanesulfonate monooxygenase SsuD/methylene tetrahydromethanopterin reductase-like flavin-dependent oxidoreductase (luciferase family)